MKRSFNKNLKFKNSLKYVLSELLEKIEQELPQFTILEKPWKDKILMEPKYLTPILTLLL